MFWKFLSVQRMLDALFDDAWCQLGVPEGLTLLPPEWPQADNAAMA